MSGKRLTSGTNSIVQIIEACSKNNVSFFKNGELEITFGPPKLEAFEPFQDAQKSLESNAMTLHPSFTTSEGKFVVDDVFAQEQAELEKENFMDTLMISDPEAYEELVALEKLTDKDE